jgi:hypothetical protein
LPEPPFIPGLRLSELFFFEAVQPLMEKNFPRLSYSAARLDAGSDVLGFDTPRSRDHGWGPILSIFVSEDDVAHRPEILETLRHSLPYEIHGYSTHFSDPEIGRAVIEPIASGPVTHGVSVCTPQGFFRDYLGWDLSEELRPSDWLAFAEQKLRTVASGKVFHDGLGALEPIREALRYYPRDVWLYLLSNQWRRIDQEEPFMGRSGDAGDDLGSRIVAARLAREIMNLCFLMERTYAPYSKWFGTAFSRLPCAGTIGPALTDALSAAKWRERERHLSRAYEAVAAMHNRLEITPPLPTKVSPFFDRPYRVIHSGEFVFAIREAIRDEEVKNWPAFVGSVNQFADSVDILCLPDKMKALTAIYRDS